MLSLTSWIRLIRNTTWLDPNRNNESIDHLRSNQGRRQDFSRGTNIFLLSPPPQPPTTTTTTSKTQIFLIPWLKMRLRCKPNSFFLYMKWRLKNSLSPYWVHWLKARDLVSCLKFLSWYLRFCLQMTDFFYHFLPLCFCAIRWRNGVLYFDYCEDRPSLLSAGYFPAFSLHIPFLSRSKNEAFLCFRKYF